MKFFKLSIAVLLAGSLFGVSCNLKSIEETQQDTKSPADVLMEERQAELDQKEADLKKKAAELEEKEESMEEEKDEDGEMMEDEDGEAMDEEEGEAMEDGDAMEEEKNLNERGREVLNDVTIVGDLGPNRIDILLVMNDQPSPGQSEGPYIKFGCDDHLIPVSIDLEEEKTQSDLATAIVQLLTIKRAEFDNVTNHVSGSGLILANVRWEDGVRIVEFEGEPKTSGVCESPRIIAQIEETVALYADPFEIRLNGSESAWRCLFDESDLCE